eukprot:m.240361 g.240361  ORF g.240361 m.240361 type:complete len:109 (-) comp10927_c0_seq2:135-461(-)
MRCETAVSGPAVVRQGAHRLARCGFFLFRHLSWPCCAKAGQHAVANSWHSCSCTFAAEQQQGAGGSDLCTGRSSRKAPNRSSSLTTPCGLKRCYKCSLLSLPTLGFSL